MPGPGDYECPSVFRSRSTGSRCSTEQGSQGVSTIIGTAPRDVSIGAGASSVNSRTPRTEEPDTCRFHEPEAAVPDSARLKYNAPPRSTFGKEERMGKVMDSE